MPIFIRFDPFSSELIYLICIVALLTVSIVLWRSVTVEFLRMHNQDQPFLYPTMLIDMIVDCVKAIRLAIKMRCKLPLWIVMQLILMMIFVAVLTLHIKHIA